VTITSASKAFNLAGLRAAVCHIGAAPVRARLDGQPAELFGSANLFGVQATLAAWGGADDWLDATIDYLDANRRLVGEVLGAEAPHVRLHLPEATYLAWLDCRALHWGDDPAAVFRQLARVQLSSGPDFNPGGAGFVRLNFACPRPLLRDVLERMVAAAAGTGPC
jgi:cystathionine beta-lyase